MTTRAIRSSLCLLLVATSLSGCDQVGVEPISLARTWVASHVDGVPMPATFPATVGKIVYEADTLRLESGGQFVHSFITGLADPSTGEVIRSYHHRVGAFQIRGSRLTLHYECVTTPEGEKQCTSDQQGVFMALDHLILYKEHPVDYRAVVQE